MNLMKKVKGYFLYVKNKIFLYVKKFCIYLYIEDKYHIKIQQIQVYILKQIDGVL